MNDADLHHRLMRFLLCERAAGESGVEEIWSAPLSTRIAAGDALAGLSKGRTLGGGPRFSLGAPENRSRFRAGDSARLGNGDDPAAEPEVRLIEDDRARGRMILEPAWGADRAQLAKILSSSEELVLDRSTFDMTGRLSTALERALRGNTPHQRRVRALLEEEEGSSFDPELEQRAAESADKLAQAGLELNTSQREAFIRTWACESHHLVQGPPGTGKTWLLALLASALAFRGEHLLITAFTHRAVDNALLQIAGILRTFGHPLRAVRLKPRRDSRWTLEQAGIVLVDRANDLQRSNPGSGLIVGATLLPALGFPEARFHRVFIDEAAQVSLPHATCALLAGRKWAFFGDDQQLGPVITGEHRDVAASASLFSHLRPWAKPTLLDRTYRLNQELCAFPSAVFYQDHLQPADIVRDNRFQAGMRARRFKDLLAPTPSALLIPIEHQGYRTHSPPEAELAADLAVEVMTICQVPPEELAIISPFRLQNREIQRALIERLGPEAELPVVDTVERIQGQEREIVIVSLTCSDPDALRRDTDFFFSPNRLCVTLTRARTKLIVLASPHLLRTYPHDLEGLTRLGLFQRMFNEFPRRFP